MTNMRRGQTSINKITRPTLPKVFPRKRLFRLLDQGSRYPVTWITGPPGSGKTTLVAGYLDVKKLPCLWYQMDEGDSDIASFFYYMGLAVKKAAPRIKQPLPLLTPEYQFGIPTFTRRYFEDFFSKMRPHHIIVFDNYQTLPTGSPFHEVMLNGLSEIPQGIKVIVISRIDPPAVFTRLEANKIMSIIGWEQLRLTPEETSGMMKLRTGKPVSKESLQQLYEKTSGWAAGVVLMETSQTRGGQQNKPETMKPGKVSDYFAGEIFDKIDERMQDFLLKTAYLSRMTPRMAEAITGRSDAGRILADLNRRNYFTERRTAPELIYQYHALFREFLQKRAEQQYVPADRAAMRAAAADLLEASGQIEAAAVLFHEAGDWKNFLRLVLAHAQTMFTEGRTATLERWLQSVPGELRERQPWVQYWLGVSRLSFDPAAARVYFERAFNSFKAGKVAAGLYLSWSGIVDSFVYAWSSFDQLDIWIREMERIMKRRRPPVNGDAADRAAVSMFCALMYRQPDHPAMRLWESRVRALISQQMPEGRQVMIATHLVFYYLWKGDLQRVEEIMHGLRAQVRDPSVAPLTFILWKNMDAMLHWFKGEHEESRAAVRDALQEATSSGIVIWNFMLAAQGAYSALAAGDQADARKYTGLMSAALMPGRHLDACQYYFHQAWEAVDAKDGSRAERRAQEALQEAIRSGSPFPIVLSHYTLSQILGALGHSARAAQHLAKARGMGRKLGSDLFEYKCLAARAQMLLDQGQQAKGLKVLEKAFALGRRKGFVNADWWRSAAMQRLCAAALDAGIEAEYARKLIKRQNLEPDPSFSHLDAWPWPIRVSTLGGFEVRRDGKPLIFSKKVQKKPLQLLKALIALGGKEVREDRLTDLLWPDAEGDAAHKALGINIIRLRRLLGTGNTIAVRDGSVSLDPRSCWVDVWAFEKAVESAECGVRSEKIGGLEAGGIRQKTVSIVAMLEKALALYSGPFLAKEPEPWPVPLREKLRDKFLRSIDSLGTYVEQSGEYKEALRVYQRGLDADDLAETYYQRMMNCYVRLGRSAEALSVYHRCKKTLAAYGVEPSEETMSFSKKIIKKER